MPISTSENTNLGNDHALPALYSFITFRQEYFGGIVFNPYLGMEENLNPTEARIIELCDGKLSWKTIRRQLQQERQLAPEETDVAVAGCLEKLRRLCALNSVIGNEVDEPRAPRPVSQRNSLASPKNVIWDVTYRCNLSCPHCLTDSGAEGKEELDTSQAITAIRQLASEKVMYLSLSGGEPFMRQDLGTLLEEMCETGMRVDIATNGVQIPEPLILKLRQLPVFQVQVSIDGIGEVHDRFRGRRGAFAATTATLRRLREEGIATSISTTATPENVGSLDQIIDLAVELGCSGYKAIPFLPAGRGRRNPRLLLNNVENRQFCETLARRSKELAGKLRVATETSFNFLLDTQRPASVPEDGPMICSAGQDTLGLGADGTLYPCPFLHSFPLGNIKNERLRDVWIHSSVLNQLRGLTKRDMLGKCHDCEFAPDLCRGGCRAAAYLTCGDFRGIDVNCFAELAK